MATKQAQAQQKKPEPKQEVIISNSVMVSLDAGVPDYVKKGLARGSEQVGNEDVAIPRLEIVQSLSPIRENDPSAREGMLFNSVTSTLYGTQALVVPVIYSKQWLVWKDRKKGGGFRGAFPTQEEGKARIRELVEEGENAKDYAVIETPTHLCLLVHNNGAIEQVAIAMPRSKMKVNRKWNAAIQIAGGDRFSRVYLVSAVQEANTNGEKYYNFNIKPMGFVAKHIYQEAESLYDRISRVGVVIDHGSVEQTVGEDNGEI